MWILAGVVSLHAGNGAEVFIDRAKVVVREMAQIRPGHDLKQIAIKRSGDAIRVWRAGAWRMEMVGIDAGADGVEEFFEVVATDRLSARVGSEIARDDLGRTWDECAEVSAAAEVGGWIGVLRLIEVGIATGSVFGLRAGGVAAVAVARYVDEVAAEAYKRHILALHIEGNGRGVEADLYARITGFGGLGARRRVGCGDRDRSYDSTGCGDLKQSRAGHEISFQMWCKRGESCSLSGRNKLTWELNAEVLERNAIVHTAGAGVEGNFVELARFEMPSERRPSTMLKVFTRDGER